MTNLTIKALKAELDARNIQYKAKAKKEDLIMLLEKAEAITTTEEQTAEQTVATEQTAEEQTAEPKRPLIDIELFAETVASHIENAEVVPVKPNGQGIKIGKTRVCAIYRNKSNHIRVKSNKIEQIYELLVQYDPAIQCKVTADKRDCLLDFNFQELATVESFLVDLCSVEFPRKKRAKKAAEQTAEQPTEEQTAEAC